MWYCSIEGMLRFAQYCHERGSPTPWTSPGRPEGVVPEDPPPWTAPSKCHHDEATTDCSALAAVIERLAMARRYLSHFHIKPFLLYFGDITNYRWHGINSSRNCFPFLLKKTDFPFWISENRTSVFEPVKLFFLRLYASLMTQHFLAQERGNVALFGIILGVEYANLLSSCT